MVVKQRTRRSNLLASEQPTSIDIVVSPDIRAFFTEREVVTGHGGFQTLSRMLSQKLENTTRLQLTTEEFHRVVRYATLYGDGGFQQRLRKIVTLWVSQQFSTLVR